MPHILSPPMWKGGARSRRRNRLVLKGGAEGEGLAAKGVQHLDSGWMRGRATAEVSPGRSSQLPQPFPGNRTHNVTRLSHRTTNIPTNYRC